MLPPPAGSKSKPDKKPVFSREQGRVPLDACLHCFLSNPKGAGNKSIDFSELYAVISQKIDLFITTAVNMKPTYFHSVLSSGTLTAFI